MHFMPIRAINEDLAILIIDLQMVYQTSIHFSLLKIMGISSIDYVLSFRELVLNNWWFFMLTINQHIQDPLLQSHSEYLWVSEK